MKRAALRLWCRLRGRQPCMAESCAVVALLVLVTWTLASGPGNASRP
jgi:hypothetical protein